jgi:hypothetical protein
MSVEHRGWINELLNVKSFKNEIAKLHCCKKVMGKTMVTFHCDEVGGRKSSFQNMRAIYLIQVLTSKKCKSCDVF